MPTKIQWLPPTNTSVGSVLIYRAVDNIADSLGSRTLLTTIGAKDSSSNWVTTYSDSTGSADNYYRIQFFDGTGSSNFSEPISGEFQDILASLEDVRRIARISANSDLGSDEIYYAIQDATDWIYQNYGDPIKKTAIFIDSTGSPVYDFTGDMGPVYQIRRISVGTTDEALVSGSSYFYDLKNGLISFASAFLSDHQGEYVFIEWVPQTVHILCKNVAALDIVETGKIIDGEEVINPLVRKFERTVGSIMDSIRLRGVWNPDTILDRYVSDSSASVRNWADYIGQKIDRGSLRIFNLNVPS